MAINLRRGTAGSVVLNADSQVRDCAAVIEEGLSQAGAQTGVDRMVFHRHDEGLAGDLGQSAGIDPIRSRDMGESHIESVRTQGIDGGDGLTGGGPHGDDQA